MKHTLIFIVLLLVAPVCLVALNRTEVGHLFKTKGPPMFVARSISFREGLLECDGLAMPDVEERKSTEKLRGHVLLFCEPWDGLWLSTALIDSDMRRAMPFMGLEGPGKKFLATA